MQHRMLFLAVLFLSLQISSAVPGIHVPSANQGLLKLFDQTCQNLYGLLSYSRVFKSITVLSTQPVRVRVEMEMTSPQGTKETFTTEGMICQKGYNTAVGQTICRAYEDRTYIGAFQDVSWYPRPGVIEDQCHFHHKGDSITVPCTFILENLQCATGERDLAKCVTSPSALFQHSCASDMHVSVVCSNSATKTTTMSTATTITTIRTTTTTTTAITTPTPLYQVDINPNATWVQNGCTVAGGNGKGNAINQLNLPHGLYVYDDQTIYIADHGNDRVMEWIYGATDGQVVAGGNGRGQDTHQLSSPRDLTVDRATDSLIICDDGNQRIVRWPRRNGRSGEIIIANTGCHGVTIDENGSVYVSDGKQVKRYRIGESEGTVVADQLSWGRYLFVDRDHSVYVSDWTSHRVVKWIEGAKQGVVVAGGQGSGRNLTQLSYPTGVFVDQLGTVYVLEEGNRRIMHWPKGATQGDVIVGGNGFGEQAYQLSAPHGLSFDRYGNLYVVDAWNNRIQKFKINLNPIEDEVCHHTHFIACQSGNYDIASTWCSNKIPSASDIVIIPAPFTVTIPAHIKSEFFRIDIYGILQVHIDAIFPPAHSFTIYVFDGGILTDTGISDRRNQTKWLFPSNSILLIYVNGQIHTQIPVLICNDDSSECMIPLQRTNGSLTIANNHLGKIKLYQSIVFIVVGVGNFTTAAAWCGGQVPTVDICRIHECTAIVLPGTELTVRNEYYYIFGWIINGHLILTGK